MTAFSQEEHGMMRGIWGELETINRFLTRLVELLERQEQERQHPEIVPHASQEVAPGVYDGEDAWEDRIDAERKLELVKATRRRQGRCLLCGATRKGAGSGCYEIESTPNGPKTWMGHSWPEETPQ